MRPRLIEQPGSVEVEASKRKQKAVDLFFPYHERTLTMKKLLIASAVSAAFAAPATALAQARVPTLSQVLDASGVSVNGYIDAAYSYANRNIQAAPPAGFSDRVFDSQNNSFDLHQFGLTVAKTPKEGFGGVVNLTIGSDAQVIHSFPETTASTFDLTQAYGQYSAGALTLMAGKFTTLAGTEVIASTGNVNFSRSILFGAIPFTHTGVRASYAPSDTVTVYGGLNNGWDQLTDGNRGKTLELGATLNPLKPLTVTVSGYFGQESASAGGVQTGTGPQGMRNALDAVANYIISNSMSVGAEVLYVSQENTAVGTAKYNGAAGYFTYMLNSRWRAVARAEMFDDKNGFHFNTSPFATGTATGVKYKEVTLTLSYLPNASIELRGEVRGDRASSSVFVDSDGSAAKSLLTAALQAIYKF
ncbi:MAG TPA: outer membrane beta-barrel protein [Burkholderiales bacterium]